MLNDEIDVPLYMYILALEDPSMLSGLHKDVAQQDSHLFLGELQRKEEKRKEEKRKERQ